MESYLRLIIDRASEGFVNMAVDESLLRRSIAGRQPNPILRFYQFSDSVKTVGYGLWSRVRKQLNAEIQTIRRITGGGIVLHGADLVYSFVAPLELHPALRRPRESYRYIHEALCDALSCLGIEVELLYKDCAQNDKRSFCFDSPVLFDVMLGGKKIAGAGQKRSMGYLLQQGSIEWNVISKVRPDLTPSELIRTFSSAFAGRLGLPVKDLPISAEELEELMEIQNGALIQKEAL